MLEWCAMKLPALAVLPFLLSGCYLAKTMDDRSWDEEKVRRIEVGKTTKSQLLSILGPPKQIVRLLDSEAYMYIRSVEKQTGVFLLLVNTQRTDKQYDAVTVIVNREGIVTGVGSRFASESARYGFPWSD